MEVYVWLAVVLVVLAAFGVWKMRSDSGDATAASGGTWSELTQIGQLELCRQVFVGGNAYDLKDWERQGTSPLTPAYRFTLVRGDVTRWLHVQTGPRGAMMMWLLEPTLSRTEVPVWGQYEIEYGWYGSFRDSVWGESTRYAYDDVESGTVKYGRFFSNGNQVVAPNEASPLLLRDMVSYEWHQDQVDVISFYGTAVDPRKMRVR